METSGPTRDPTKNLGGKTSIESELVDLFQFSLEMLCIASGDGYFKRVNPAFERTLGHSAQVGFPSVRGVHPPRGPSEDEAGIEQAYRG